MTDLNTLANDGFAFPRNDGRRRDVRDLALLSLRVALKAYTSTYKSMRRTALDIYNPGGTPPTDVSDMHGLDYAEACAETIVHFQHFAELVCKDILREEHELLATDAASNPTILHKLLKGEDLTEDEQGKARSAEFRVALTRLKKLITAGRIDGG